MSDKAFPQQQQEQQPGLQHEMTPSPAVAESYRAAGKLKGKKLLITGGDSGIGRSVVVMAAMEGVDGITILHTEDETKDAHETVKLAEKHGAKVITKAGDIADVNVCKEIVESHIKEFKTIDILVNNAAEQHVCEFLGDIDLDQVHRTFKTNSKWCLFKVYFLVSMLASMLNLTPLQKFLVCLPLPSLLCNI
jgi:NAD(P)-dependent dehydrogenase (short-subunit alcohol dehydrogenase family)